MTDRERWTIYPLLALSIGMQMRDKLLPSAVFHAPAIHCQALTIGDGDKTPRIVASANGTVQVLGADNKARVVLGIAPNHAGVVDVRGADGPRRAAMLVDEAQQIGSFATFGSNGHPRVVIAAVDGAGVIDVCSSEGQRRATLSVDEAQQVGRISTFGADGHPRVIIAAVDDGGIVTTAGPGDHKLVELGIGKPWAGLVTPPAAATDDAAEPAPVSPPQPIGGQLVLFSAEGKPQWLLTHDERGSGRALAFDEQGHLYLVLMATLNVTPGPPGRTPPAADAPRAAEPSEPSTTASPSDAAPATDKPDAEPPANEPPPETAPQASSASAAGASARP